MAGSTEDRTAAGGGDLRRYVDAWQGHVRAGGPGGEPDARRILDVFAEDGVWEDVAVDAAYQGHAALREMFDASYQFAPTLVFDVVQARAADGGYVIEWEMHAEGTGAFGDLPATDKPFRVRGVSVGALGPDGKVVLHRDYWDRVSFLGQIGLLPAG